MNTFDDDMENDRIAGELREAIGEAQFDYPALVAGVHHRVGRIRRRRALVTGAAVAVLTPTLVGGTALVLPGLLPGQSATVIAPAATGEHDTSAAPESPATPPWQEGAPPLPEGGLEATDSENAWRIPDARPSGVAYLDAFGPPKQGMNYRRTVPVSGVMACNAGTADLVPLAGQSWYYYQSGASWDAGAVDIQVTGWQDSRAARQALQDDTMTWCSRDTPWQPLEWAEHAGDEDYLLHHATAEGLQKGFAVVRQGDYLIAVTVTDTAGEVNAGVAAEIAAKTADNMMALDAVHGRD